MKKLKILCDLGVGGERGRVFCRKHIIGALSSTDYKDPPKAIKLLDNIIMTENALTNERTNERTNRILRFDMDGGYEVANRVYSSKGICPSIKARDYKESAKVIRQWIRN